MKLSKGESKYERVKAAQREELKKRAEKWDWSEAKASHLYIRYTNVEDLLNSLIIAAQCGDGDKIRKLKELIMQEVS